MLDLIAYLNQTLLFDWYMVKCGSKKGRRKNLGLKETELHAQSSLTIVGSPTLWVGGRGFVLIQEERDFSH